MVEFSVLHSRGRVESRFDCPVPNESESQSHTGSLCITYSCAAEEGVKWAECHAMALCLSPFSSAASLPVWRQLILYYQVL